jgi:hypothetical protein
VTSRTLTVGAVDRLETEGMWLAAAHYPEPFGTVTRDRDGRHRTGRR